MGNKDTDLDSDQFQPLLGGTNEDAEDRGDVVQDLIQDESEFVKNMQTVVQVFMLPLREAVLSMQPILNQDQIKTIFSTVEVILSLSSKLQSDLSSVWKEWPQQQNIGEKFLEMTPYLNLYAQYLGNFESAVFTLSECARQQPAFSSFLETAQSSAQANNTSIFSLLIMPLERVASYSEDLERLVQCTESSHADYEACNRAMNKVLQICIGLEDKLIRAKELEQIWLLQQSIKSLTVNLLEPGRKMIREGFLFKQGKMDLKARWFVLFNDIIICTEAIENPGNSRYRLLWKWRMPLSQAGVDPFAPGKRQHGFILKSARKNYTLYADSEETHKGWVDDLKEYIGLARANKSGSSNLLGAMSNSQSVSVSNYLVDKAKGDEDDEFVTAKKKRDPERPTPSWKFPPKLNDAFKTFDDRLIQLCQRWSSPNYIRFYLFLNFFFSLEVMLIVPVVLLMYGEDGLGTELNFIIFLCWGMCSFLKRIIWRTRPYRAQRATKKLERFGSSFPCTTVIYSVFFCFIGCYAYKYYKPDLVWALWMPVPPLIIVVLASMSRIATGLNYPSDCLFGVMFSLIVCVVGSLFFKEPLLGCQSCAWKHCYVWRDSVIKFGSVKGLNMFLLLFGPFASPLLTWLFLRRPVEFNRKSHLAVGFFVGCGAFQLTYLCPRYSPGDQALVWPDTFFNASLAFSFPIAVLCAIGCKLADKGKRGAWKRQIIAGTITTAVIVVSLTFWRVGFMNPEQGPR